MENIYSSKSLKNAESSYNGIALMESAANGIISFLRPHLDGSKLIIICGSGNNGGDGWAVASILYPYPIEVIYLDDPKTEESIFYKNQYKGACFSADSKDAKSSILNGKIVLDCIFGIGLSRPAQNIYKDIIDTINESDAFVMSVDIPSGLSSDESKDFPHVCADETVCITSRKLSSAVFPTKEAYGKIHVFDIGVNMTKELPLATISDDDILEFLPKRPKDSHKGTFGTLKTLCGSYNMTGAGILAITGALRCGVGLVKAFGDDKLLNIFKVRLAEPIYKTFSKEAFISEKSSAILIGCGIGTEYENDLRDILINADSPIIIDADGINFLSKNIDIIEQIPTSLIITPHPKEMARLCGCSVSQIQENRFSKCKEFSEKYGCTVVLKGAGTIIFTPNQTPIINESGNSGLSKGGSGDVLAGMISAFVAQGVTPHYASALGVYLHGLAADSLKKSFSEFSFLPSDIPKEVGKILAEKLL